MQITIREPGSAITHFIAMMIAVFATVPLLLKAGLTSGTKEFTAMAIFMLSTVFPFEKSNTSVLCTILRITFIVFIQG